MPGWRILEDDRPFAVFDGFTPTWPTWQEAEMRAAVLRRAYGREHRYAVEPEADEQREDVVVHGGEGRGV